MKKLSLHPEFVKRMVVDSENIQNVRKKFFNEEIISRKEMDVVMSIIPYHRDINWGKNRLSMVPWTALDHLHKCIIDTVEKGVDGDFVETGAWRGGACIIAKSVYDYLKSNKKVYVVDSFEGLPKPDSKKYPDDKNDVHYLDKNMKASLKEVRENFKKFGLLDNRVVFLKGWFKDTLPKAPIKKISILRLDGDMFESTIDVLKYLYHKLSIGGYCIIDDYQHPACRTAVDQFRKNNDINEPIIKVDKDPLNEVHFWIKKKETFFDEHINYSKRGLFKIITLVKKDLLNLIK